MLKVYTLNLSIKTAQKTVQTQIRLFFKKQPEHFYTIYHFGNPTASQVHTVNFYNFNNIFQVFQLLEHLRYSTTRTHLIEHTEEVTRS